VSSNPIGLSPFFLKRGGQTVIFSEKREQKATLEKPQQQQTRGEKKKYTVARASKNTLSYLIKRQQNSTVSSLKM